MRIEGAPLYLLRILVLAGAYYGAAKLGLTLAFANRSVTAVWPPTGIALTTVVLWGYRVWPGVALGALFANGWGACRSRPSSASPWATRSKLAADALETTLTEARSMIGELLEELPPETLARPGSLRRHSPAGPARGARPSSLPNDGR
jgi:integral membrane sensor domain MASE1